MQPVGLRQLAKLHEWGLLRCSAKNLIDLDRQLTHRMGLNLLPALQRGGVGIARQFLDVVVVQFELSYGIPPASLEYKRGADVVKKSVRVGGADGNIL